MKNSKVKTDCLPKAKFQAEDLVWAKLRGFPWWPAKILGQSNEGNFSVQFYGDGMTNHNMTIPMLKPYDEATQSIAKLCKTKPFKLAVEEANLILKGKGKKVFKLARRSQPQEEQQEKSEPIKVNIKNKNTENNVINLSKHSEVDEKEESEKNKFINKKRTRSLSEVEDINKNINEEGTSNLIKNKIRNLTPEEIIRDTSNLIKNKIRNLTPEEIIKTEINKKENVNPLPNESNLILEIKKDFLPNFKSDVKKMSDSFLNTKMSLDILIKTIEYYNPSIKTEHSSLKDEVYSELVESLITFTELTFDEKCINKLINLIAESLQIDVQGLDSQIRKLPLIAEKLKERKDPANKVTMVPYFKEDGQSSKIKKSKYGRFSEFYDYTKFLLVEQFALNLDEFPTLDEFCDHFIFGDYLPNSVTKLEREFKRYLDVGTRYEAIGELLKVFRTNLQKFSFKDSFMSRFCSFVELKSKEKFPLESQEGDYKNLIKKILQDAKGYMLFKLLSSADTGYFYVGKKSVERAAQKISLMKFDPLINQHVLFIETKMKSRKR